MYVGGAIGFPSVEFPARALTPENAVPVYNADRSNGLQLIVGVRIGSEGIAHSRSIEVDYRIGDKRYREEFPIFISVCAPPDLEKEEGCGSAGYDLPEGKRVIEWSAENGIAG